MIVNKKNLRLLVQIRKIKKVKHYIFKLNLNLTYDEWNVGRKMIRDMGQYSLRICNLWGILDS